MSQFKLLTYNINFSQRTIGQYEVFDWNHRKELVLRSISSLIDDTKKNILCFQEVMPDSEQDLLEAFHNQYQNFKLQTHPTGRSVMTFIPKDIKVTKYPIANLGENCRDVYLALIIEFNDQRLLLINSHLPMEKKYREIFSKQLVKHIGSQEFDQVLVCGDFNTFSDEWGPEQVALICNQGKVHDATSYIYDETKTQRVFKTFDPYPYDIIPDVPPFNLDHIFVSNLKHEIPVAYPFKSIEFQGKKYGASDHYAITMNFFINNNVKHI